MIKEGNDSPGIRHCHVSNQLKNEGNQQNLKKRFEEKLKKTQVNSLALKYFRSKTS